MSMSTCPQRMEKVTKVNIVQLTFKPYLNNFFHNNWGYCNGIDNAHLKSFFFCEYHHCLDFNRCNTQNTQNRRRIHWSKNSIFKKSLSRILELQEFPIQDPGTPRSSIFRSSLFRSTLFRSTLFRSSIFRSSLSKQQFQVGSSSVTQDHIYSIYSI